METDPLLGPDSESSGASSSLPVVPGMSADPDSAAAARSATPVLAAAAPVLPATIVQTEPVPPGPPCSSTSADPMCKQMSAFLTMAYKDRSLKSFARSMNFRALYRIFVRPESPSFTFNINGPFPATRVNRNHVFVSARTVSVVFRPASMSVQLKQNENVLTSFVISATVNNTKTTSQGVDFTPELGKRYIRLTINSRTITFNFAGHYVLVGSTPFTPKPHQKIIYYDEKDKFLTEMTFEDA
ncbi:hypothetical protein CRV050 [Nile crocodilepox virus]|uniref:Uncharacterized protein n=1 Tax=Nile crocodilepox virus (isolate Crocodylus niloticus/Zimbabwe/Ume/2001) TaxID=1289473 RepID=Q070K1_CPRVZ|nr:hypothetical protein CRV050 [Nile crocodilepox virus]ABJ08941.1 hypothetical protein CRV050 [Nile crocodilepox virus]